MTTTTPTPQLPQLTGESDCSCAAGEHDAEFSHVNDAQGAIFAVTCPADGWTTYVTREAVRPAPAVEPHLTPAEAMERLHVSRSTLNRYVDRGLLTAHRLPGGHRRFERGQVEALAAGATA